MTEQPHTPRPPAGWYPHPSMAGTQRYWDGAKWTDNIAPMRAISPTRSAQQPQLIIALVLAGSVIGLIMALQSASLLTGTGTLWTGVAIASGACVVTWIVKSIPTWVRVVAVLVAFLAIANVVFVESQLEDMRQDINNLIEP